MLTECHAPLLILIRLNEWICIKLEIKSQWEKFATLLQQNLHDCIAAILKSWIKKNNSWIENMIQRWPLNFEEYVLGSCCVLYLPAQGRDDSFEIRRFGEVQSFKKFCAKIVAPFSRRIYPGETVEIWINFREIGVRAMISRQRKSCKKKLRHLADC